MLQCGSPEHYPLAQGTLKMEESRQSVQALCSQQDRPSITDSPGKQREAWGTQRWTLCNAIAKKSLMGKWHLSPCESTMVPMKSQCRSGDVAQFLGYLPWDA